MKSKFKINSYFFLFILLIEIILFVSLILNFESTFNTKIGGLLVLILFFCLIFIFSIEIKNKMDYINIEYNQIIIKKLIYLGKIKKYSDSEIDGFTFSKYESNYGCYNYIYLIRNKEKILTISDQYHKNFKELSIEIKRKYKDLGFVKQGFITELKDSFR